MKKPKLSEIRTHYEGMVAKDTGAFYLLDLVKRLGEALEGFARRQEFPCDYCLVVCEEDGSVRHGKGCPDPEARALLKELEL